MRSVPKKIFFVIALLMLCSMLASCTNNTIQAVKLTKDQEELLRLTDTPSTISILDYHVDASYQSMVLSCKTYTDGEWSEDPLCYGALDDHTGRFSIIIDKDKDEIKLVVKDNGCYSHLSHALPEAFNDTGCIYGTLQGSKPIVEDAESMLAYQVYSNDPIPVIDMTNSFDPSLFKDYDHAVVVYCTFSKESVDVLMEAQE